MLSLDVCFLHYINNFNFLIWCVTTMNVLRYVTLSGTRNGMLQHLRGRRGRDRMVVGFTTTYVISAYHHWCYVFESRSGRGVQHYVMKFVSDLRQVSGFLRVLRFPPPIKLTSVLKMPGLSIYPEHGNPEIRAHLNRMVYPRDGRSDLKAHIVWTTTRVNDHESGHEQQSLDTKSFCTSLVNRDFWK
jgi:hypothetical protein